MVAKLSLSVTIEQVTLLYSQVSDSNANIRRIVMKAVIGGWVERLLLMYDARSLEVISAVFVDRGFA